MVDDPTQGLDGDYNLCHVYPQTALLTIQFWSNFEIADMRFFRSKIYSDYFKYLDEAGGFFYERWGDAPVHSIAAAFFLPRSQVHFFHDIGYRHAPYIHCPQDELSHLSGRCSCERENNFGTSNIINANDRLRWILMYETMGENSSSKSDQYGAS
jgi:alpha 1,2-mannosyltransferase